MMKGNNRNGRKPWLRITANKTNGMEKRRIFLFMDNCLLYHGDGEIDTFNSRKLTENKVTELFCIADDVCKFFDAMMEKYYHKSPF